MSHLIAPLIAIVVALLPVVQTPQEENPVLTQVKAIIKDPAKPFTLVVRVKVKIGAGPTFEAAFAKAIKESRKEKGNKAYDLNRSAKVPTEYLIYERWENLAALEAHLKTPHFAAVSAEVGGLLTGPPDTSVNIPVEE